jgi:sulfide:quinone oxidoreductase
LSPAKVVVLGGGAGGTVAANHLARSGGVDVTLVDNHGLHLHQAMLLYLPFGSGAASDLEHDERALLAPDVKLRVGRPKRIDADRRTVVLEDGELAYDWLVIATGSRVFDSAVPGSRDFADHFHCPPAAEQLQKKLAEFKGGRVAIGFASLPYKCPPTPVEFAFLLEDWLRQRGLRDRTTLTYFSPLDAVLNRPEVAAAARPWLEEKGFAIRTGFAPASVEPGKVKSKGGEAIEFDLLVMVPPHAAAPYLRGSSLAGPLGFVATDRSTMKVADRIYAIGDTTDLPVPKTAAAAQEAGPVAARNVRAEIEGSEPSARYDGHVLCYMETGDRTAARIEFDYDHSPLPLERGPRSHELKALLHRSYFQTLPSK